VAAGGILTVDANLDLTAPGSELVLNVGAKIVITGSFIVDFGTYNLSGTNGAFTAGTGPVVFRADGITGEGTAGSKLTVTGSGVITIAANAQVTAADVEIDITDGSIVLTAATSKLLLAADADDSGSSNTVAKLTLSAAKSITSATATSGASATAAGAAAGAGTEGATDIKIAAATNDESTTTDPAQITTGVDPGSSLGTSEANAALLTVAGGTVTITGGAATNTISTTSAIAVSNT
jgi:hypothetical protein